MFKPSSKSTKRRRFLEEVQMIYAGNPEIDLQQSPLLKDINNCNVHENVTVGSDSPQSSNSVKNINSCQSDNIFSTYSFQTPNAENEWSISSSDFDSDDEGKTSKNNFYDEDFTLIMLAQWAVNYNINNMALSALLVVLKLHKCFKSIPIDARTILKTKDSNLTKQIQSIPPGIYYHFGIANGLKSLGNYINFNVEILKIVIGIDGLPLTKSSLSSFWPILGYVRHPSNKSNVFLIGLYWGKEKAVESNIFIKDLVSELKELYKYGFESPFGKKSVVLDAFCCDAPAKSYILKIKGHTGYSSCTKCHEYGVSLNNRICFTSTNSNKRTHSQFLDRIDEDYHITETISLLTEIPEIDMVSSFPLGYMHLTCLGIVKKLLLLWLGSLKLAPHSVRLQSKKICDISHHLSILKNNITSDFSRTPRGLHEIPRWKATEFRQFLLYTGPIVLEGVLSDKCYLHFICLHVSFRILLVPNNSVDLITFVENLLIYFVKKFGDIYGETFMSHNIHGLLHIVEDYKKFGALDNCSCFPFENFMKSLKKMIRKHEKPLEQVIKRYSEKIAFNGKSNINLTSDINIQFKKPHNDGPLADNCAEPQFKIVIKNSLKINCKSISDCYIGFITEGKLNISKVYNICCNKTTGKYVFLIKSFKKIESLYKKPINSLKLGIAIVGNLSNGFNYLDVEYTEFQKYVIFQNLSGVQIAFPILHSFYD